LGVSLSRTPIRIRLSGLGEAEGELSRICAPLTVETLLRRLPLKGRAHPISGGISFIVGIKRGEEKPVSRVEAGTIAYWPRGDAINVFHSPVSTLGPVNRVGSIKENLEIFRKISSGVDVRVDRVTSG